MLRKRLLFSDSKEYQQAAAVNECMRQDQRRTANDVPIPVMQSHRLFDTTSLMIEALNRHGPTVRRIPRSSKNRDRYLDILDMMVKIAWQTAPQVIVDELRYVRRVLEASQDKTKQARSLMFHPEKKMEINYCKVKLPT